MKQIKISIKLNSNPMSIKKSQLKNILFLILFFGKITMVLGQTSIPDTLLINTKQGKIILVSDSILNFKKLDTKKIIDKAISQIQDSIVLTDTTVKKQRLPKDSIYSKVLKKKEVFLLQLKGGGAFAAGRFTPTLGLGIDFAPQRQDFYWRNSKQPNYTFINLSLTSFWFFDKPLNGQNEIFQNNFLEGSFGNRINTSKVTGVRLIDEFSFGAGYLIKQRGNYFGENTTKLFITIVPKNSFVGFKPELYFTNSFRSTYLGLSFRLITPGSKLFKP